MQAHLPPPPPAGRRVQPEALILESLDDRALLTLLLSRSASEPASSHAADRLFDAFGDLASVASADLPELSRVSGLGLAALRNLRLTRLLGERFARVEASRRPVITSWTDLLSYVRVALASEPREQFRALFLDRRNHLLRDELAAHGTIDHAPVYPREVVRRALEVSAAAIILVHNHPSGDPEPSRADIVMTQKIIDAAKLFDIQVYDHLIVARHGTASLRALGHLK